jgi:hypothetical protein
MGSYVEPRGARHKVEIGIGGEQLRIPIRREWFVLAFLPFWLAGWTVGGIAAMRALAEHFEPFLLFWLGGWAVGWLFAAGTLAAQLAGAEIVRADGRDLEVSMGVGPLRRTWRYRGDAIRNLTSIEPDTDLWGWGRRRSMNWFFARPKTGAVKFDYGAESVYLASGVDEPEGREIVAWLARRLPRGAVWSEG